MKSEKILLNDMFEKSSIEYQLIEYVNKDPLMFVEKPISIISKKLHINTSTLTRTIRKIGYKNYRIFRNFIIEKITEYKNYLITNNIIKKTSNILDELIVANNLAIDESFTNTVNDKKFDEAVHKIITAKKILLYGIGFSHFICNHIAKHLQNFNINGYSILNFYDALQLANTSPNDLWIIVSIALTASEIIFLLEELTLSKENEIILITSNNESEILKRIQYIFKLKTPESKQENEIFNLNLKVALITLANLIILEISNKRSNTK